MKKQLIDYIEQISPEIISMANEIFDYPEIGLKEYKASEILCNGLEKYGFTVEKGIAGLDTAFRAEYESGSGGVAIGLLCEYDALEEMGHACAHHMQGPVMLAAAASLKENLKDEDFKLIIYGTPAEETVSGKITMLEKGFFKDIDIALMVHGAPTTTTDIQSLAMSRYKVRFHGISAHAAIKPEEGRSALDAALLMFNGIEFMREHVQDDTRIHYTILNAGGPANAVQKYSETLVYLRNYNRPYLDTVVERFKKIVQGAALMTETDFEIIEDKVLHNKIPVLKLNDLIMETAEEMAAPAIRPPREKTGSTDFGNVMYIRPGSCLRIAFVPEGTSSHSQKFLDEGKSENMEKAIVCSAKIIAEVCRKLINDTQLRAEIIDEFNTRKNNSAV